MLLYLFLTASPVFASHCRRNSRADAEHSLALALRHIQQQFRSIISRIADFSFKSIPAPSDRETPRRLPPTVPFLHKKGPFRNFRNGPGKNKVFG